jgi:hypothetical protein
VTCSSENFPFVSVCFHVRCCFISSKFRGVFIKRIFGSVLDTTVCVVALPNDVCNPPRPLLGEELGEEPGEVVGEGPRE